MCMNFNKSNKPSSEQNVLGQLGSKPECSDKQFQFNLIQTMFYSNKNKLDALHFLEEHTMRLM